MMPVDSTGRVPPLWAPPQGMTRPRAAARPRPGPLPLGPGQEGYSRRGPRGGQAGGGCRPPGPLLPEATVLSLLVAPLGTPRPLPGPDPLPLPTEPR